MGVFRTTDPKSNPELESIKIEGFPKGLNNIQPDYALIQGAALDILNADVFDSGKVRRRRGFTVKQAGTRIRSLWSSHIDDSKGYYVDGANLYEVTEVAGALTSSLVATGINGARNVSYVNVNGDTFWSDGIISGRVVSGINREWGYAAPAVQPVLTPVAFGGMVSGRYQVVLTYRTAAGEESAATSAQAVVVPAGGGIQISGMVVPPAGITQKVLYITPVNGDIFYRLTTLAAAVTSFTVSNVPANGVTLKTQFLDKMPACIHLEHFNGVIYGAAGNTVWHTEPLRYGLADIAKNFYSYPAPVTCIKAVPDGIYVCADRTYFIRNPATPEVQQTVVAPFGAVPGTAVNISDSTDVAWFSPRGQIVASAGGQVTIATKETFLPGTMVDGASLFKEKSGLRQIVNVVDQQAEPELQYERI